MSFFRIAALLQKTCVSKIKLINKFLTWLFDALNRQSFFNSSIHKNLKTTTYFSFNALKTGIWQCFNYLAIDSVVQLHPKKIKMLSISEKIFPFFTTQILQYKSKSKAAPESDTITPRDTQQYSEFCFSQSSLNSVSRLSELNV